METQHPTRPPLSSLACPNEACALYGQVGQSNLTIRKTYGQDQIRYLKCGACQGEFSERKNTALWNSKISERTALKVAEHLAEGCSLKATARLMEVAPSTVRRLNRVTGHHAQRYHHTHVQNVVVEVLEADERHGFAGTKGQPAWEAELIDPVSKFVLSHTQGRRDATLIRALLADGATRLANRHALVLFTDGEESYASLFPELFGTPYQPPRQGPCGRRPKVRYRIPRTLAHVQIIKHRQGQRLTHVEVRQAHGSAKLVARTLAKLGYQVPNTSAIERRNGTARRMNTAQVRRSLAFARRADTKLALGWWTLSVYNWCRPHQSLRRLLETPAGKKSMNPARPRWRWGWLITFSPFRTCSSPRSSLNGV